MLKQLKNIGDFTNRPTLLAFAEFVLGELAERTYVDYRSLDLMKVHRLVPGIFVYDIKKYPDEFVMHFCGTDIDRLYGRNMVGQRPKAQYRGPDLFTPVCGVYRQAVTQKKPCYTIRNVHLMNDRVDTFTTIETVLVPCSANDADIDFTLAYADTRVSSEPVETVLALIH